MAGGFGNDFLYGEAGTDVFGLSGDVRAGDFDYLGDFNTGGTQDFIALPTAYAGSVSFFQYGTDVIGYVPTGGTSYYSFYVDGPAPITAAEVQAATFFI